jgi:hypothetical protein
MTEFEANLIRVTLAAVLCWIALFGSREAQANTWIGSAPWASIANGILGWLCFIGGAALTLYVLFWALRSMLRV